MDREIIYHMAFCVGFTIALEMTSNIIIIEENPSPSWREMTARNCASSQITSHNMILAITTLPSGRLAQPVPPHWRFLCARSVRLNEYK
ncbi:hypothetical protein BZL35_00652 [Candidatus Pandoraea novymonadis]|uniref:Secreted protein n=1 Tax=Candidatus Pandoraea novymonadis TaxID=1808959 RepID=A0ABX5FGB6_9BURK|nr:hypothetical protein BZL35_00652 [Candidatus Pandoraea novymonadis]